MNPTRFQTKTQSPTLRFRILEEAREAVTNLSTLKPFLSPQDKETLVVLMDKGLTAHLEKSLSEADDGKFEPLESILK